MIQLGGGWDEVLSPLFESENYLKIREFLKKEYSEHIVYPDMFDIFNCFRFTAFDNTGSRHLFVLFRNFNVFLFL